MYNLNSMVAINKTLLTVTLITLIPTLLFWAIFTFNIPANFGWGNVSLKTIIANYDGPNYLVISKCGYDKQCIRSHFSLPTPLEYYPAHLPGFPLVIKVFSTLMPAPVAMLIVALVGSLILNLAFYQLTKSLWLTFIFTLFPARLFILRSVGAPETLFVGLILWSIVLFKQKKYLFSAIAAAFVQLLKSPGILLFAAYALLATKDLIINNIPLSSIFSKYKYYLLVPITVLLIFCFYYLETGDFLAYFHSGDNFHLNILPYLALVSTQSWVNGIWLEDIVYIFLLGIFGTSRLVGKYKFDLISIFPLIFLIATLMVAHRDISRYIAPLYPFMFLAFAPHFHTKAFKFAFILLIPAIYLYAINFVIGNVAPVADWTPYL